MAVTIAAAFAAALDLTAPVADTERLPLARARGRILAAGAVACASYPAFDHAAVDGYAVRAADCTGAPIALPCPTRILPGGAAAPLETGMAARIFTGAALPPGADAVVMQEDCTPLESGAAVRIGIAPEQGAHIRRAGEDMRPGMDLLPAGVLLDARHLAAAAAADLAELTVRRRVRVAILSCGNELVAAGTPAAAQPVARDSNRPMLAAFLARPWISVRDLGILPDAPAALAAAVGQAADWADLVVTSGGMSVGDSDHLAEAVAALGGRWAVLQVRMKPGKPLGIGLVGRAALLALPGNPYAAFVGAAMFGGVVLRRLSGQDATRPRGRPVRFAEPVPQRSGRTEFVPVAILDPGPVSHGGEGAGLPLVRAVGPGGSARLAPLLDADGLAEIDGDAGTEPPRFHAFADLL